jgi:hypothetical protein
MWTLKFSITQEFPDGEVLTDAVVQQQTVYGSETEAQNKIAVTPPDAVVNLGGSGSFTASGTPGELLHFFSSQPGEGWCTTSTGFRQSNFCRVDASGRATWRSPAFEELEPSSVTVRREKAGEVLGAGYSSVRVLDPGKYVALGDSFSAGEGLEPYLDECHRNAGEGAWPALVTPPGLPSYATVYGLDGNGTAWDFEFPACSGARTVNVFRQGAGGGEPQGEEESGLTQLEFPAVDFETSAVTMTIGGNDVGFSGVLSACAVDSILLRLSVNLPVLNNFRSDCTKDPDAFFAELDAQIENLGVELSRLYSSTKDEVGPDSSVVISGYPRLFPEASYRCGWLSGLFVNDDILDRMNASTDLMNDVIAAATAEAGVWYVDVRDEFDNHGVCDERGEEWINGPTRVESLNPLDWISRRVGRGSFHPNRSGYEGYAGVVSQFLADRVGEGWPTNGAGFPLNPAPAPGAAASSSLTSTTTASTPLQAGTLLLEPATASPCRPDDLWYSAGEIVTISGGGFDPGSSVDVASIVGETSAETTTIVADSSGDIQTDLVVPAAPDRGAMWLVRAVGPGGGSTRVMSSLATALASQPCVLADAAGATVAAPQVTVDVLANDSPVSGPLDLTSVVVTQAPTSGAAVVNTDGSITYTADPGFYGNDSFIYWVCDDGGCGDAAVGVTVDAACTISGTPGDDTLTGTSGTDVMCGGDGADVLNGMGGDDILLGGPGIDVLSGGVGDDQLYGGPGDDRVTGGAGTDVLMPGDDPGDRADDLIVPETPDPVAVQNGTSSSVSWLPVDDGGSPVTSYTVDVSPAVTGFPATVDPTTTSTVLSGLSNNIEYTISVTATNAVGASPTGTTTLMPLEVPSAWAAGLGPDLGGGATDVAVASDGTILVTGTFDSPSVTIGSTTLATAGDDDAFVVALDSATGGVLWATRAGSSGPDSATSIAVDGSTVVVTGTYTASMTGFGAGAGASAGGTDAFVAALNLADGAPLWAVRGGGVADDQALGSAIAQGGEVFVSGAYRATPTGVLGGLGVSRGGTDVYVVAIDAATGTASWRIRTGAKADDLASSISVSGTTLYVAGTYVSGGSANTVTGFAASLPKTNSQSPDAFVSAVSSANGNSLWNQRGGGPDADAAGDIAADATGVYVVGDYHGSPTGFLTQPSSAGLRDAFAVRLDPATGATAWAARSGSTGDDRGSGVTIGGATVYVAGAYTGTPTGFAAGAGTSTSSATDGFVAALNATTGASSGASRTGNAFAATATSIAASAAGPVVVGTYTGSITGYGAGAPYTTTPSRYIVRLQPAP